MYVMKTILAAIVSLFLIAILTVVVLEWSYPDIAASTKLVAVPAITAAMASLISLVIIVWSSKQSERRREEFDREQIRKQEASARVMEERRQKHIETLEKNRDQREEQQRKRKAASLLFRVVEEMKSTSDILAAKEAKKTRADNSKEIIQLIHPNNLPKCESCVALLSDFETLDLHNSFMIVSLCKFVSAVQYLNQISMLELNTQWSYRLKSIECGDDEVKKEVQDRVRDRWQEIANKLLMFVYYLEKEDNLILYRDNKRLMNIVQWDIDAIKSNIKKGYTQEDVEDFKDAPQPIAEYLAEIGPDNIQKPV